MGLRRFLCLWNFRLQNESNLQQNRFSLVLKFKEGDAWQMSRDIVPGEVEGLISNVGPPAHAVVGEGERERESMK